MDSRIPVDVSGTWILDSNLYKDSVFLELDSGFQSLAGFSNARIPDSASKIGPVDQLYSVG